MATATMLEDEIIETLQRMFLPRHSPHIVPAGCFTQEEIRLAIESWNAKPRPLQMSFEVPDAIAELQLLAVLIDAVERYRKGEWPRSGPTSPECEAQAARVVRYLSQVFSGDTLASPAKAPGIS